jgi:hypothetical protein
MHHYDSLRKSGPIRIRCTRLVLELSVFQPCYSRTSISAASFRSQLRESTDRLSACQWNCLFLID